MTPSCSHALYLSPLAGANATVCATSGFARATTVSFDSGTTM
jgi:hypothetical protein